MVRVKGGEGWWREAHMHAGLVRARNKKPLLEAECLPTPRIALAVRLSVRLCLMFLNPSKTHAHQSEMNLHSWLPSAYTFVRLLIFYL